MTATATAENGPRPMSQTIECQPSAAAGAADSADEQPDVIGHVRAALTASAAQLSAALDQLRPADRRRQRALDRWFSGFAAQVRSHLELVDSMVVPALAARGALDEATLERLAAEHAWIDDVLSDLGDALGVLSFGLGAESLWIGKASDLAAATAHVLRGQLAREQRLFAPLVSGHLDADEREALRYEAMRAVANGPTRFSLAWLYAHVDAAECPRLAPYAPAGSRLTWRSGRPGYHRTSSAALG